MNERKPNSFFAGLYFKMHFSCRFFRHFAHSFDGCCTRNFPEVTYQQGKQACCNWYIEKEV